MTRRSSDSLELSSGSGRRSRSDSALAPGVAGASFDDGSACGWAFGETGTTRASRAASITRSQCLFINSSPPPRTECASLGRHASSKPCLRQAGSPFENVLDFPAMRSLTVLNQRIASCTACPRLVTYRQAIAQEKRRQYRDWIYWGRPVPGFGDPAARLYILGLAPAAHGGNRTGRIFTGDRSGDWLYEALYAFGFANQPTSQHKDDGLVLTDCHIGATVRCAPPDNKPAPEEFERCRPYVRDELRLLPNVR